MTPLKNNIIVESDISQKETIVYGTLKLDMPFRRQYNTDERIGNPVLAVVKAANDKHPEIEVGDVLLLSHMTIMNKSYEINTVKDVRTLAIPVDRFIYGKIGLDGEVIPLSGNIVVERTNAAPMSSIIITPDSYKKTEDHRVRVKTVSGESALKEGDMIVCYKYSDYAIIYNLEGEEKQVVMVWKDDVLAVA